MVVAFPATESASALRAYLVLIGCAADEQTITYGELAKKIRRGGPRYLEEPLDCVARWCSRNELPQLTSIVVDRLTRLPAASFNAGFHLKIRAEQEKVWKHDWFSFFPPTIEELGQK